jgi:hypothetical protein
MGWNGSSTDGGWLIDGDVEYTSRHTGRSNSNRIISCSETGLRQRFPRCLNRDVQMIEAGINYKFEAGVDPASEVSKYSRDPTEDENLQKQSQNPVADFVSEPFQSKKIQDWAVQSHPGGTQHSGGRAAASLIITSNWLAAPGQEWTVPIGGGFGGVFRLE